MKNCCAIVILFWTNYSDAVSTVHPDGMPCVPVTFHVAVLFLTNVPDDATSSTQLSVYVVEGVVVNIALM